MCHDKTRVRSKVESDFGIRVSCTTSSEEAPKANGNSQDENIDSFARCHKVWSFLHQKTCVSEKIKFMCNLL